MTGKHRSSSSPEKKIRHSLECRINDNSVTECLLAGYLKINLGIFFGLDGYLLSALTELLMPYFDRVTSRRNIGQLEITGSVSDAGIGRFRRNQPSVHPAVHVALYFHRFRLVDLHFQSF